MQTRIWSAAEVSISTLIGYIVAVTSQVIVFPWFGLEVEITTNMMIGAIFTVISIARGYAIRRAFNWYEGKR